MSHSRTAMSNAVHLASVFREECVVTIPSALSKEQVVERLLYSLVNAQLIPSVQVPSLLRAIVERERAGTTALGKGLAMPHLRTPTVCRFVGAIGLAPEGVDFQSLDGAPTKLVLLVLGPYEQREQHIELMGRISMLFRDKALLMFLQGERTPRQIYEYIVELDTRSSEPPRSGTKFSATTTTVTPGTAPIGVGRV